MPCEKCKHHKKDCTLCTERAAQSLVKVPGVVSYELHGGGFAITFNNGLRDWIPKSKATRIKGYLHVSRALLAERKKQHWP